MTILKLPPHVTDLLQPLDASCFGPLKKYWEDLMNNWVSEYGAKQSLKKGLFATKLCEVWHKGLSPDNIKVSATGFFLSTERNIYFNVLIHVFSNGIIYGLRPVNRKI